VMRAVASLAVLLLAAFGCRATGTVEAPRGATGSAAVAAGPADSAPPASTGTSDRRSGWPLHGRDAWEQRYSPLDAINTLNVSKLGLAFAVDLGTNRGIEATPIVVDGVLYLSSAWSVVHAFDAATGKPLWRYDPKVPRERAKLFCCGVVNRGVAHHRGQIYFGTLDGRLIALDAKTGKRLWETLTVDPEKPYSITGAPRVVRGHVLIGNAGADLGVRGYVSAYDRDTGKLVWRFYTVPGPPGEPQESKVLERALATWKGDLWWKVGGGGTVWDSMAYDRELDLLFIGTGNGSPWARSLRSPGGGDNLFLSSILALRPETGELVWHYQTTPGDNWDFTATQSLIVADLELEPGTRRRVVMQAPKNGFFYVLDAATGKLLSAENYVEVTWASGVDPKTGRPIETGLGDYSTKPATIKPGPMGGHTWHSMAYSPKTGLAYIPAQHVAGYFVPAPLPFTFVNGSPRNTGIDLTKARQFPADAAAGELIAWDPVRQKKAWGVPRETIANGGVLSTAGLLVFQGTATGRFTAHHAKTGKLLWEYRAGTGIIAAPITYAIEGEQYVAIAAGWGGGFALNGGDAAAAAGVRGGGRLLVFRLGGDAKPLPDPPPAPPRHYPIRPALADAPEIERGASLFSEYCAACHGVGAVGGGVTPDLRFSTPAVRENFARIVNGGELVQNGMPAFAGQLAPRDLHAISLYLADRAYAEPIPSAPPSPASPPRGSSRR